MTRRPLPVRPVLGLPSAVFRLRGGRLAALLGALVVLATAPIAALASPGEIAARKAEVQDVLNQIDELDISLEGAIEAYNAASVRLDEIKHAEDVNAHDLEVARNNLKLEQNALARRLVAIYKSGDEDSALGVLFGASSLTDLVDRMDTIKRVNDEDARVARDVKQFKASVLQERRELRSAHRRQSTLVAERQDRKREIEGALAERRQLVESIKGEIARLEAEERARQERLRREAEARLAAAQAEAERQRVAREAARETAIEQARENGASEEQVQVIADAVAPDPTEDVGVVASTPDATVAPTSEYGGVVGIAMQYLGVPYVWGGESPGGFDCSGLVVYVYRQLGRELPHYTGDLWNVGVPVSYDQLQPGDLVFFYGLGHVGIYIGGGQMIHAPHTGDVVKISDISSGWYSGSYDGARRIL